MKKLIIVVIAATVIMVGCSPVEQQARDTAAALSGLIVTVQNKHLTECQANPGQGVCQAVNRGIAGENALITATETYCGFALTPTPPDPTSVCHPVKDAETGLKTAISNATQLITELKGVAQ